MKTLNAGAIALSLSVLLTACGGGDNKNTAVTPPVAPPAEARETLAFTGSFINGAHYVSGARTGITGFDCTIRSDGCFDVLAAGDKVTFSLGSITLPEITTVGGQQEISTTDIARALSGSDTSQGTLEKNNKAIYAILRALDPDAMAEDGVVNFDIKPAVATATARPLAEIIANVPNADSNALAAALAGPISDSTGEDFAADKISFADADTSEIGALADGFNGGIQPIAIDFGDRPKLNFLTSDLVGLVSFENPETEGAPMFVAGYHFADNGNLDLAFSTAGTGSSEVISGRGAWNIVDSVLVIQLKSDNVFYSLQCIVTERRSITFSNVHCKLVDDKGETNPLNDVDVIFRKVDLASVLSADDGKWNAAFEARNEDTVEGSFTFMSNANYMSTILTNGDPAVTNGKFNVDGLFLELTKLDNASETCAFAGAKTNAQGQIEDVFLRCISSENQADVLLTKRAKPEPLDSTLPSEPEAPPLLNPDNMGTITLN